MNLLALRERMIWFQVVGGKCLSEPDLVWLVEQVYTEVGLTDIDQDFPMEDISVTC